MGQCSMNLGCIIYAILSSIVYIMCKSLNFITLVVIYTV